MPSSQSIRVGPLKKADLAEADRILRLAFATYLGLPNPSEFMDDRKFIEPRFRAANTVAFAARDGSRLIGSMIATRWGSFGFFGPLTVLPEYWDRGVAKRLLAATVAVFDDWGVRHSGLFTFAQSAKHVGLYQKFGYWPQHLTAILTRDPEPASENGTPPAAPALLSALKKSDQAETIRACARLTDRISRGLDLSDEIRSVLAHKTGDVVLARGRSGLDGFAICMCGPGSEGGEKTCYVKFGAVRGGKGDAKRFDCLLQGCEALAAARGAQLEAGVNLARGEAFRHMRSRGYRVISQGVAMQRPHSEGFNRPKCWVIDDWR